MVWLEDIRASVLKKALEVHSDQSARPGCIHCYLNAARGVYWQRQLLNLMFLGSEMLSLESSPMSGWESAEITYQARSTA